MAPEARKSMPATILLAAVLLAGFSCGGDGIDVLDHPVYGFRIGEKKEDLFKRAGEAVSWKPVKEDARTGPGETYEIPGALDGSREVSRVTATFLGGRLMKLVVHMRRPTFTQLDYHRERLESLYGTRATCPDGTTETAFKTWRIKAPGMLVTLKLVIKKPEFDLFVQYTHDRYGELAGRK
jgi:hypothetical protein